MTAAITTDIAARKPDKGTSLWADAWRRLRRNHMAMVMMVIIILYALLAILVMTGALAADWKDTVGESYQPPSAEHLLGTDIFGQSVLRKTLYGAKISLTVALLASLLSVAIGVPLGAIAGYFGGLIDELIVWLYSTLSSIPGFLLILAFAFVLREKLPGISAVYLALGLTSWVGLCRLIRGEVLKHRDRDYVTAAVAYGASRSRVIFRHVVPNVTHLILIDFSLRFVGFIHAEVILSYLGLGSKEEPSWGAMINEAKQELARGVWWQLAAATTAILILSLALNIVGDALRDALDPKLRK